MTDAKLGLKLVKEINDFLRSHKSLMLSTLDKDNLPCSSYAPFITFQNNLYIFISQLAQHTIALLANPVASVMLIEDESSCSDIFARTRLSYRVDSTQIPRDDELWAEVIEQMTQTLGERMSVLSQLGDFVLFRLTPISGRYVKGFGKAYELSGSDLTFPDIDHINKDWLSKNNELHNKRQ